MKRFAYVTEKGIMHVVKEKKTAEQYSANGKVVETEIEAENGYPVVKGKQVIVYGESCMKLDAKGKLIEPIPELADLYKQCI